MASNLKWRAGFGWGSLALFLISAIAGVLADGLPRVVGICLAVLAGGFMVYQYQKWNSKGWPSLHWRAMLLYSTLAGLEMAKAKAEGRDFDRVAACRELGLRMCGSGKELNVEAMLDALLEEEGSYLASLLSDYRSELLPDGSEEDIESMLDATRRIVFGPTLVICNVVENTYGRAEAAHYAYALVRGRAT